jgi:hypothetical protein
MRLRSSITLLFASTYGPTLVSVQLALSTVSSARADPSLSSLGSEVSSGLPDENRSDRRLQSVAVVGDNGSPSSRFPLGLCQGDCDRDSDCAGTLRCFQRNGGQDVPGCAGGAKDRSKSDYCYNPNASVRPPPAPVASRPVPAPARPIPAPVPSPAVRPGAPSSITSETFILKLYWEEGYYWQEESFERRWCIQCRNGCKVGKSTKIVNCDNDGGRGLPNRFRFLPQTSKQVQIQEVSSGLCMQLAPKRQITLAVCQASASTQRFFARVGELTFGSKFELSPVNRPTFCVTQRHHPKDSEIIELEPCDTVAERSDTSFWNLLP